jgi:hypothetical protein
MDNKSRLFSVAMFFSVCMARHHVSHFLDRYFSRRIFANHCSYLSGNGLGNTVLYSTHLRRYGVLPIHGAYSILHANDISCFRLGSRCPKRFPLV